MEKLENAYHSSLRIYDAVMTQSNPLTRLYSRVFWGGRSDTETAEWLLARIPDDFAGTVLDAPVGTAVFTHEKWARLTDARVLCLDYSRDMLEQAAARLAACPHVSLIQGDIGALPFTDGEIDLILCMNGFQVFPDKARALREMRRVLRPGGVLLGCFYVRGESRASDWLARAVMTPRGWFMPPFLTAAQAERLLRAQIGETELHTDGALAYFACRKTKGRA